jgi:2-oxoglutarate ferredoxin oxidoreductase subunit alpha
LNGSAEKFIIATSLTSLTAKAFIEKNPEFGLIIIKFLKPLDERLVNELQ